MTVTNVVNIHRFFVVLYIYIYGRDQLSTHFHTGALLSLSTLIVWISLYSKRNEDNRILQLAMLTIVCGYYNTQSVYNCSARIYQGVLISEMMCTKNGHYRFIQNSL